MNIGTFQVGSSPCIVGSITREATLSSGISDAVPCDVIEIRYDLLDPDGTRTAELFPLFRNLPRPLLFTCRMAAEGGLWTGTEEDRKELLYEGLSLAQAVDVELNSGFARELADAAWLAEIPAIVSFHDFQCTPPLEVLQAVVSTLDPYGPGVIGKLVCMVKHLQDMEVLRSLLQHGKGEHPLCVMGMGEDGIPTRFEFPELGSVLVYGFIDAEAAPGQVSCLELQKSLKP